MLTPVIILNSSPESWTVPPFAAPKFNFPGLALAWAMSSEIVITESDGLIATRFGTPDDAGNRRNVAAEIEIEFRKDRRGDGVRCRDIEQRIAVGSRPHGRLGADVGTRAGPVFDDELLTEALGEPLSDQAGDNVRRVAG